MSRVVFAFAVAMMLVATLLPDVSADFCHDCSIRECDHPCKIGDMHACQMCHSIDVPKNCNGCRGRRKREAFAAAAEHMAAHQ